MSIADWMVLLLTLGTVIAYGLYKSRHEPSLNDYIRSNNSMGGLLILLSVMGTQASAITFLSAPGQAFTDGMRFVQYYFGLPLAMVVLCVTLVPIYHKLNVYTAYEFLEKRFDQRMRTFTSLLFLISRGLSTGISIYAPSIILSSLLGWNIYLTNLVMGGMLIIYTMAGGAKAVAYTQMQQLLIIFSGMFLAGWMMVDHLPDSVGFADALHLSGSLGKMNIIETSFEPANASWWKDKYNIWSGLIGGFFLALSYFGTDQSQVGRYLTARSLHESRTGLLLNGMVKVPMQFLILMLGVLLFSFYMMIGSPLFYNQKLLDKVHAGPNGAQLVLLEKQNDSLNVKMKTQAVALAQIQPHSTLYREMTAALKDLQSAKNNLRKETVSLISQSEKGADTNDTNYIFLHFVINHLPHGVIGLLIAVIFLAAWGSIAAALHSLSSSTVIDIYKRSLNPHREERHYYHMSKYMILAWGIFCIATAMFASKLGSLIEAVNVLGSLFYGTILGIFAVAFYMKSIGARAIFYAALTAELAVIFIFISDTISFLWLNAIGCLLVMFLAYILSRFLPSGNHS